MELEIDKLEIERDKLELSHSSQFLYAYMAIIFSFLFFFKDHQGGRGYNLIMAILFTVSIICLFMKDWKYTKNRSSLKNKYSSLIRKYKK